MLIRRVPAISVAIVLAFSWDHPSLMGAGIRLDGGRSHVIVGEGSGLSTPQFTVECWFKWQGRGEAISTGVGGVTALPLLARGGGETDGTGFGLNYFLGLDPATGRVVADFQDLFGGHHHPVTSGGSVAQNAWTHAAAVFNGKTWRLYVNGRLEVDQSLVTVSRIDSRQMNALGTTLDGYGFPDGFFHGLLDECRVWNRARTAEEIAGAINRQISQAEGLVARWAFEETGGTT
ncbi:MAG: LamG domain-containing protein, partial [Planctomycetaceae bacterium]|nr:LamG domain-containing protein [Planctomycetaceae bacterium]